MASLELNKASFVVASALMRGRPMRFDEVETLVDAGDA